MDIVATRPQLFAFGVGLAITLTVSLVIGLADNQGSFALKQENVGSGSGE